MQFDTLPYPGETDSTAVFATPSPDPRKDIPAWQRLGMTLMPLDPDTDQPVIPVEQWMASRSIQAEIDHFEAHPSHAIGCVLPEGHFVLETPASLFKEQFMSWAQSNHPLSLFGDDEANGRTLFIRTDVDLMARHPVLPDGFKLRGPGQTVRITKRMISDTEMRFLEIHSPLGKLDDVAIEDLSRRLNKLLPVTGNPMDRFSVRGQGDALAASAQPADPLLGKVCLGGQVTIFYAPPNSGKTLVTLALAFEAVQSGRMPGGNIYYLNADDSSSGLAEKTQLLEDVGVHVLAPGLKGFDASKLAPLLCEVVDKGKAKGTLLIVDTLKKFMDLTKRHSKNELGDALDRFRKAGGTVLLLAHTNKARTAAGRLVHTGTNDMLEDADAAFLIDVIDGNETGQRVAVFENLKARGPSADKAAFAYDGSKEVTYEQRLATVTEVNPETLAELQVNQRQVEDAVLIETIKQLLSANSYGKMELVAEVKRIAKVTKRQALKVIAAHTGEIPGTHLWTYTVQDRGRQVFTLLPA